MLYEEQFDKLIRIVLASTQKVVGVKCSSLIS